MRDRDRWDGGWPSLSGGLGVGGEIHACSGGWMDPVCGMADWLCSARLTEICHLI